MKSNERSVTICQILLAAWTFEGLRRSSRGELRDVMPDHRCDEVQKQAAAYISELTTELAAMARDADCNTLTILLEMARLEARNMVEANRSKAELNNGANACDYNGNGRKR